MRKLIFSICLLSLVVGCATANVQPKQDENLKFKAAAPRSILIVPAVNHSVEITAPDYFLSTITIPLAEQGYYVFPVNLVKRMLEDDGLSDTDLVHHASVEKLTNLFGADAVLYVTINQWDARYIVLTTQVTVDLSYVIKDGKTGDTLWEHKEKMVYAPQNSNSGNPVADLIAMAITAAITKAVPDYIPLATQANARAFAYPGPGIPPGPYRPPPGTTK